jgi:hypothetical protein
VPQEEARVGKWVKLGAVVRADDTALLSAFVDVMAKGPARRGGAKIIPRVCKLLLGCV